MKNLTLLNETFSNGYNATLLDLVSVAAIVCSIYAIISKNPIILVLFLIALFLSIASYLMLIGISFIGISYLLVYVGSIVITIRQHSE